MDDQSLPYEVMIRKIVLKLKWQRKHMDDQSLPYEVMIRKLV